MTSLPTLPWHASAATGKIDDSFHSAAKAENAIVGVERLSHRERLATPIEFRDLLLSIARSARPKVPPPAVQLNQPQGEKPTGGG